jgi:hypothetical protein
MESRYRTADGDVVVAFESGTYPGEDTRRFWFRTPEGDDAFTVEVREVKRRVATGEWTPLD